MTTLAAGRAPAIRTENLTIDSDTPGIRLHLRHKRLASRTHFAADRTVLLMHGATFASASLFDVPATGGSLMDNLAVAGFDVYAVDARGYGGSTRPAEMDGPPEASPPLVHTETAVRDLGAAVDHVLESARVPRLNLIGMSWGGSVTGAYTTSHNDKVAKLVLIAPQWLALGPATRDTGGALGAYRRVSVHAFRQRWLAAAPEAKRDELVSTEVFKAWTEVTLASDPAAGVTGMIRAPSGAMADMREYWTARRPVYDLGDIRVPVLLTHAEWDADVPRERVRAVWQGLTNARYRRFVEFGEGTHMLILEKTRGQLISTISGFLEETY